MAAPKRTDDQAAEVEPAEPTPKDRANAKQRRLEAEQAELARKLEEGEVEPDLHHGRKVKIVDGRRFVLVNGGWIESGEG
jgi:hypothetical protein